MRVMPQTTALEVSNAKRPEAFAQNKNEKPNENDG